MIVCRNLPEEKSVFSAMSSENSVIISQTLRIVTLTTALTALIFTVNNYLIFWEGWPGVINLFSHFSWFGAEQLKSPLTSWGVVLGFIQCGMYLGGVVGVTLFSTLLPLRTLTSDAELLANVAAFIARAAFWAVLLVGLVDMIISFLRVEDLLIDVVGEYLATQLGRPSYRGNYVHFPLIGVSLMIASQSRSLGFSWLALLIVLAEFQIVISRFVFSYEQAFMGDLVRFWYAALFLFASAYTLLHEGHVRVDILYAGMNKKQKAWSNTVGSLLLGVPLCWIIMTSGMWDKSNLINAPLLSFEITQSGYGLYVKYLMAAFLLVYALTMLMQFLGYTLRNVAVLVGDADAKPVTLQHGHQ